MKGAEELNILNDIDELVLPEDVELEDILKNVNNYPFPAATLTRHGQICFNTLTGRSGLVGNYVMWKVSPDYVIGLPATNKDKGAYRVWLNQSSRSMTSKVATLPATLAKEKKVMPGTYKLYRYKDGFAFKRYERL